MFAIFCLGLTETLWNVERVSLFFFSSPPAAACGGELNAPSGTISSPNYPNLYPHSRVCRWELVLSPGRRVTLTINDLRLEDSGTFCQFDYVEVSPFLPTFVFHHFSFSTVARSPFTFLYLSKVQLGLGSGISFVVVIYSGVRLRLGFSCFSHHRWIPFTSNVCEWWQRNHQQTSQNLDN